MTKITVYGIANCDIIKKTMQWYGKKNIVVDFHDYKKLGIKKEKLAQWCKDVGWETLLNKRSTTFRTLPAEEQQKANNEKEAIHLMMEHTSLIKRPVVETANKLIVGYNEQYFTKQ